LHASLLPAYRGAAPINWAIINGEKETGLTTFKLKHEIDTGDLAFQAKIKIEEDDSAGTLHDKMMYLGAELMLKTVKHIENGTIELKSQNQKNVSKAPKIFHDTCQIEFNKNSQSVYNFIRGMSPYPLAWMPLFDKHLKILDATPTHDEHQEEPGKILTDFKTYVKVACKKGMILLNQVQLEGKKKMNIADFLNGMAAKMRTEQIQ
jgi:methionyl-tRNA formyltransferase